MEAQFGVEKPMRIGFTNENRDVSEYFNVQCLTPLLDIC